MRAFIALGSNLGDRLANLRNAAQQVAVLSLGSVRKSAVYETAPLDCPPGSGRFLNAILALEVSDHVSPHELFGKLKQIEAMLGRKSKQVPNEPRPIDLDVICHGSIQLNTPGLVLPHPRAHMRRFVLQPLCDVAPDLVLPGQTQIVLELLAHLPDDGSVRLFAREW